MASLRSAEVVVRCRTAAGTVPGQETPTHPVHNAVGPDPSLVHLKGDAARQPREHDTARAWAIGTLDERAEDAAGNGLAGRGWAAGPLCKRESAQALVRRGAPVPRHARRAGGLGRHGAQQHRANNRGSTTATPERK